MDLHLPVDENKVTVYSQIQYFMIQKIKSKKFFALFGQAYTIFHFFFINDVCFMEQLQQKCKLEFEDLKTKILFFFFSNMNSQHYLPTDPR